MRILFSRVIPLEKAPASHPLWLLAEAFGAQCTTEADAGITHVVAGMRGTQKVFWALQTGKHVVLPAWCAPGRTSTPQKAPRVLAASTADWSSDIRLCTLASMWCCRAGALQHKNPKHKTSSLAASALAAGSLRALWQKYGKLSARCAPDRPQRR